MGQVERTGRDESRAVALAFGAEDGTHPAGRYHGAAGVVLHGRSISRGSGGRGRFGSSLARFRPRDRSRAWSRMVYVVGHHHAPIQIASCATARARSRRLLACVRGRRGHPAVRIAGRAATVRAGNGPASGRTRTVDHPRNPGHQRRAIGGGGDPHLLQPPHRRASRRDHGPRPGPTRGTRGPGPRRPRGQRPGGSARRPLDRRRRAHQRRAACDHRPDRGRPRRGGWRDAAGGDGPHGRTHPTGAGGSDRGPPAWRVAARRRAHARGYGDCLGPAVGAWPGAPCRAGPSHRRCGQGGGAIGTGRPVPQPAPRICSTPSRAAWWRSPASACNSS